MENFDEISKAQKAQYEVVYKKFAKVKKSYSDLKDKYIKLEIENKFLNSEIKNLKDRNMKLLKFQDDKNKIANKIKKILSKIEAVKGA
jgi:cell division protein FtsB